MAVTGVTKEQYNNFLQNGGDVTFVIDAADIAPDNEFEISPLIKPYLHSGFELRPSSIIDEPKVAAEIYVYGESWTRVITFVYRKGGKIIYRKLSNGQFQAACSIPVMTSSD